MDLTLLRAFVTVAREGNLTRSAVLLHVSQPAVSLQIKNLQETLKRVVYGQDKAIEALSAAIKLARAVYFMLKTKTVFDPERLVAALSNN